jgi:hypothetical protein
VKTSSFLKPKPGLSNLAQTPTRDNREMNKKKIRVNYYSRQLERKPPSVKKIIGPSRRAQYFHRKPQRKIPRLRVLAHMSILILIYNSKISFNIIILIWFYVPFVK